MDDRIKGLMDLLRAGSPVPRDEVADSLGVSERTVRTYVCRANDALGDSARIVSRRGHGYELMVDDPAAFSCMEVGARRRISQAMPQTSDERVAYLLNDLLNRADWITADKLAQVLYISRKTLSGNLKDVDEVLSRFDLTLVRRSHYGLRVEGSEMNRRLCLASLVADSDGSGVTLDSAHDAQAMERISELVSKVISQEKLTLSTVARHNLAVHVVVAIKRINQGCCVPLIDDGAVSLVGERARHAARSLTNLVSAEFDVAFPDEEVAYIAIHLASKETLCDLADAGGLVISDDVWGVVARMIRVVWEEFRFDFRSDIELRMNLARHIVPLSVRLHYHIAAKNPMTGGIKRRLPLAYLMASESAWVLEEHFDGSLSDGEKGYLALAFELAIERQQSEPPKKSILIVCASGRGTARLLAARVGEKFGPYVGTIRTCDVASVAGMDFSDIDYVFSTVPITCRLPVPMCQVDILLDDVDVDHVCAELDGDAVDPSVAACFSPDLFCTHMRCATKDECLASLCGLMEAHEGLDRSFSQLVDDRERLARTAFGNLVALPHPTHPVSDRTMVCVGLLDEPVDWGGIPVRAVFLSSIARLSKDGVDEEVRTFNRVMASLLMSSDAIAALLGDQRFGTLLRLVAGAGGERAHSSPPGGLPAG